MYNGNIALKPISLYPNLFSVKYEPPHHKKYTYRKRQDLSCLYC